jgi:predicted PurR-regulated permease PerM
MTPSAERDNLARGMSAQASDGPSTRAILRIVGIVVVSVITLYLIYLLRRPITWIVIAAFIAVALSSPVALLERSTGRRGRAIALVYLGVILVPVLIGAILVPPLVKETNKLVDRIPSYANDVTTFVQKNRTLRKIERDYNVTGKLQQQAAKLPSKLGGAAGVLSNIGLAIVNSLFAGITILILSIFMIGSGGRWIDAAIRSRPPSHHAMLRRATSDISGAVAGYVAGAIGQALVAGVTSFIVLTILGVPYASALALIIALLDLVPLVGATLGALLVGIVTLFNHFPTDTIIWVVWSIVYQQIENTVIQPRIQARSVNVAPIVVLVAVLFGSTLFGILGALLAIPAAATIQITVREYGMYRKLVRMEAIEEGKEPPEPPPTILAPTPTPTPPPAAT